MPFLAIIIIYNVYYSSHPQGERQKLWAYQRDFAICLHGLADPVLGAPVNDVAHSVLKEQTGSSVNPGISYRLKYQHPFSTSIYPICSTNINNALSLLMWEDPGACVPAHQWGKPHDWWHRRRCQAETPLEPLRIPPRKWLRKEKDKESLSEGLCALIRQTCSVRRDSLHTSPGAVGRVSIASVLHTHTPGGEPGQICHNKNRARMSKGKEFHISDPQRGPALHTYMTASIHTNIQSYSNPPPKKTQVINWNQQISSA